MKNDLKGLSILVTRPKHQAATLCQLIEDKGGKSILFPTIAIEPIADQTLLKKQIQNITRYDIAIFVSANAIRFTKKFLPKNFSSVIKVVAIGPGTAKALENHHITVHSIPTHYNSEGLLKLPLLNNIEGQSILIFCGENSRPFLKETLEQRGAKVEQAICYQRQCPKISSQETKQICSCPIDFITSTSQENLQNLVKLFSNTNWLQQQRLLVIKPTMADYAKQLGFTNDILISANASDEAIIETLLQHNA